MSNYIIKKDSEEKTIICIKTEEYYTFSSHGRAHKKVSSFTIYDENKINKLLVQSFLNKYQALLNMITNIEEGGTDASGYEIVLGEVQRLKDILNYKYQKYLKQMIYNKFLSDLTNLENYAVMRLNEVPSMRR